MYLTIRQGIELFILLFILLLQVIPVKVNYNYTWILENRVCKNINSFYYLAI